MPLYVFESVAEPGRTTELVYHMHDAPSVGTTVTVDGVKWRRVFTKPQASIDTRVDPFSARDYIKATGKGKGCVGDLWDRSKELSLAREAKEGVDPIKQDHYNRYAARRKGKKHPQQVREEGAKSLAQAGIKVDWGMDD